MKLFARAGHLLLLAAGLAAGSASAQGIDPDQLLPIQDAFRLQASAPSRDRIEIRFDVAEGYYLYRHRMDASADGFQASGLGWPEGIHHVDEFFGEVETYRQRVTGVLEGRAAPGVDTLELRVRYQGCADVGVCYPPDTRTVQVALPAASSPRAVPATGWTRSCDRSSPARAVPRGSTPTARPSRCRCPRTRRSASKPSPRTATPS